VPGLPSKPLPKYEQVAESKYDLDWADLITLDLSKFDAPGGKEQLAAQLKDAVHSVGFFYITAFGLSQEEVDKQFAIGKEFFALPTEEKVKYRADLEHGHVVLL
jgi:isopenicillin N synthase-like dioxygenase